MPIIPVNRDFLPGDMVELVGCNGAKRIVAVDHAQGRVTIVHAATGTSAGTSAGTWPAAQVRRQPDHHQQRNHADV